MTRNQHHSSFLNKVLILEDDVLLSRSLATVASASGWQATSATSVSSADHYLSRHTPQLVLADWQVEDGITDRLVSQLIKDSPATKVVILSGQLQPHDTYRLYEKGVMEVLHKPGDMRELGWKFRRWAEWTRRYSSPQSDPLTLIKLDGGLGGFWYQARFIPLRPVEFRMLECFCSHINQVVSKNQITHYVWGVRSAPNPTTIEVYVMRLRRALPKPELLQTRRGFGYVLREP